MIKKIHGCKKEAPSFIELKTALLLFVFLAFCYGTTYGQFSTWQHRRVITVTENSGANKTDFQILLEINTQQLVSDGKMESSGSDIRFASDCSGTDSLNYWIEDGMNTDSTQIWVEVDTLTGGQDNLLYMFFGNPGASPASDFNSTFPNARIVTADETVTDNQWEHDWIEVQSGVTLELALSHSGHFTMRARKILIQGNVIANERGFLGGAACSPGQGPGGSSNGNSAGGAGYGGAGGLGGRDQSCHASARGPGGNTYGSASSGNIQRGSGGGGTCTDANCLGGNGGGAIEIEGGVVHITGTMEANGADGCNGGGSFASGGGSGGGILVKGDKVIFEGDLSATGGDGGWATSIAFCTYGGGGAGGGRIKFFYDTEINQSSGASTDVSAGIGGPNFNSCCGSNIPGDDGNDGTINTMTYSSEEPTWQMIGNENSADAGIDRSICAGDSVTIGGNPTGPPGSDYSWTPASNLSDPQAANPVAYPNDTTDYYVTVTDVNNCEAADTVRIYVDTAFAVTTTPDTAICDGDSVQIKVFGGSKHTWSPAAGLSDTSIYNPWASPDSTTTYYVTAENNACLDTDSVVVEVSKLAADAGADTMICDGGSAQLMASGGAEYVWSPASGLSCVNCQAPIANPDATTSYIVTVSSGSCTPVTDTVKVTVLPLADAGADQSVCEGDSVQLNASGGESYSWSPTTGLSDPAVANPWAASPDDSIIYTVSVTDTNGCTATDFTTVSALPPPVAGFTAEVTGNTVDFTSTSAHAVTYEWDFDNDNTSSDMHPEQIYQAAGSYKVCLTVSNNCGSDTYCETTITSVPTLSGEPVIRVYPNPAGTYLTVELTGIAASEAVELQLYSMEGKQVDPPTKISRDHRQVRAYLTVSDLAEGFYLLRVVGESYILNEKVFVVE